MTQLLSWAQNSPLVFALVFVVLIFGLKEILLFQLRKISFLYYVILFPGVVLHELSHALFCLITFSPIKKIQFFSKTGGFVMHGGSKIPVLGDFLISIAPLISGLVIFYLFSLKFIDASIAFKIFIGYLEIAILITMTPSAQDIKSSSLMYLALLTTIIVLIVSKVMIFSISPTTLSVMYFCLVLLIVVNLIVMVINSVNKGRG